MGFEKRVLVTGAGGFIGHRLVRRLLSDGVDTVCLLRYTSSGRHGLLDTLPKDLRGGYRAVLGDLRDPAAVAEAAEGCGTILHLGALIGIPYSYRSPGEVLEVNAGGTLNVLNAARESGAHVVVTSTSEVYGTARTVPITEDHPLGAQSPYAASKIAADQLALSFHRSYGIPVTILRPFNTYGPGQSQRAVIPTIMAQALRSDSIELGSLEPRRDFLYLDDTVAGFLAAMRTRAAVGRVVQLGTGEDVSIGELAAMAQEVLGTSLPVVSTGERKRPPKSEVMRLIASPERAAELLGWRPETTLRQGLEATAQWFRSLGERLTHRGYVL